MNKIGTYAALRVAPDSANDIKSFCELNGIPVDNSFIERLHCTLIYSRQHCPDMYLDIKPDVVFKAKFKKFEIFKSQTGEYALVMLLDAQHIIDRHNELMLLHGATYDFPEFTPHITMHYKFSDPTAFGIPKFTKEIILTEEYTESLDLDWAK